MGSKKEVRSISMGDSSVSDLNLERRNTTDSLIQVDITHNNIYIFKNKNIFLFAASLIMVGGFYNCLFQGFIKNQFLQSMGFTNNQYSTMVTIPHFPNILLPIVAGPLVDIIGIRKGTFLCIFIMFIGMVFIVFSIIPKSFALILIGKILHQIGTENTHLCQSTIVSKWFRYSNLALALALCSFVIKLASSLSGIGYPYLFDQNNDLVLPMLVGLGFCVISLISAIVIIVMDKKSEQFDAPQTAELNKQIVTAKKFSFNDIKKFDGLFWLIALQIFMIWGSFYSFQNYGQSILINKFQFSQTEASSSLSILFFVGMTSPFFGHFSDKLGNRGQVMIALSSLCAFSFFLVLIAPPRNEDMKPIAYIFLILFGTAISIGNAYIFPSIPLIVDPNYLGTAFGICYSAKNAGTFTFSIIGGFALGENDQHFNHMLLFLFISLLVQVGISIFTLYYDKKRRDVLSPPKLISNKKETPSVLTAIV